MSFEFSWDKLDDEVALQLQEMIHNHFQRIPKPNFIGSLTVSNFRLGSTPPSVTVLDITDPLEEWYIDMDREEARLAREAAEAGGGESMDEEEMASDEYDDEDEDEDEVDDDYGRYEEEGEDRRGRHYGGHRQARKEEFQKRRQRRRHTLTDEEGLVMVGEGEVIEYLDSDGFDQDQHYDDNVSPERPWRSTRATVADRPNRTSRQGRRHGSEGADKGEEMRPDLFRSAIATPNVVSPASSSDSSLEVSEAAEERELTTIGAGTKKQPRQHLWINVDNNISSSGKKDAPSRPSQSPVATTTLSISPHPSDDDIESQALYTQGESTIYQQLRKLNINSTPTVLEGTGVRSPEDLDSPDGGLPFDSSVLGVAGSGEDAGLAASTPLRIYSPLLSPSGSNHTPLGSIVGTLHPRTGRPFSMSSASASTGTTIAEPPASPLPTALLHQDYHQGFGSGNLLLGLGRAQLGGVGSVFSPRSGGATPVGFESPIASLSRRPSVSETSKESEEQQQQSGRMFESPVEAHPPAFKPISQQNLDAHQRQHLPLPKTGTRSTPASVFSSNHTSSSNALDPSGAGSATASTTTRRRAGTGLWGALSPSLSGIGKVLSPSRANSVASTDSRQSGSQQDTKEKPNLVLRADQLERGKAEAQRSRKEGRSNGGGSSRGTLSSASNEYVPKQPRNPQRPRSSQKSAMSVNGWDDNGDTNPYRRFDDGYMIEEEENSYRRRVSKASSRQSWQSKEQRGHQQQPLQQRRRHRRRRAHSPSPVPSPIFPGSSKRHENDIQLLLNVHYQGQMGFTIETELLLNYPTFAFLALPIKLTITSFSFKAKVQMAYLRDHVNVCFLEPEDPNDHILSNVRFQSQVGDEQKQAVLKNVTKVEHFVVDQLRKFIMEDFVYPSYHSIQLVRPQQQQQQQSPAPSSEMPVGLEDDRKHHGANSSIRPKSSETPSSSSSRTPSQASSIRLPPPTIPSAGTTSSTIRSSSAMDYDLHRRHRS